MSAFGIHFQFLMIEVSFWKMHELLLFFLLQLILLRKMVVKWFILLFKSFLSKFSSILSNSFKELQIVNFFFLKKTESKINNLFLCIFITILIKIWWKLDYRVEFFRNITFIMIFELILRVYFYNSNSVIIRFILLSLSSKIPSSSPLRLILYSQALVS